MNRRQLLGAAFGLPMSLLTRSAQAAWNPSTTIGLLATVPAADHHAWWHIGRSALNQSPLAAELTLPPMGDTSTTYGFLELCRAILAVCTLGLNPVNIAGRDLTQELASAPTDSNALNPTIWRIIALRGAGWPINVPPLGPLGPDLPRLITNRNTDNGWSFVPTGPGVMSDADNTAAALLALRLCNYTSSQTIVSNALAFLASLQRPDGGIAFSASHGASNSASTAWTLWAISRFGISTQVAPWNAAVTALENLQQPNGAFLWQSGIPGDSAAVTTMTSYAAIALSDRGFPVPPVANATDNTWPVYD